MPELVGFQTMVILDPYGMTFDAVGVFGLVFHLLFKSCSSYCETSNGLILKKPINVLFLNGHYIQFRNLTCAPIEISLFCANA